MHSTVPTPAFTTKDAHLALMLRTAVTERTTEDAAPYRYPKAMAMFGRHRNTVPYFTRQFRRYPLIAIDRENPFASGPTDHAVALTCVVIERVNIDVVGEFTRDI